MATHIAFLPSPGMGHLIPAVQFAQKLHHHHHISTTLLLPTDGPLSKSQSALLSSLPPSINYLLLPPVNFDDLPADVKIETRISLTVSRSLPSIHDAVKSLHEQKHLSALVVDLFGTDAFEIALNHNIPPYIFFPSTAMLLSLFLYLPKLHETVSCQLADVTEKIQIPGCVPMYGSDLLQPLQDRHDDAYKWVLHHARRYPMAHGIIFNSFKEMEPGPISALQNGSKPTVYPIGPLIQNSAHTHTQADDVCLNWLADQPTGSVLYVSFGSGGSLSHEQMIELALGLEMSEHRFLWVVRCPNNKISNASYFNVQSSDDDPLAYLPEGFLDRTRKRGLIVPMWAPQAQILAHESTGAFVTHCGWNSTLESVVNGVPMIAWPLYAEQRMNTVILCEDVRVALRLKVEENGLVGRVEIANRVKNLMEGEEGKGIRSRMRELKEAAARALLPQTGSSTIELARLAATWKAES